MVSQDTASHCSRPSGVCGAGSSAPDTMLRNFTCFISGSLCLVHMRFLFSVYFYLQLEIKEVTHVLTATRW